jgi:hypothetical protein
LVSVVGDCGLLSAKTEKMEKIDRGSLGFVGAFALHPVFQSF